MNDPVFGLNNQNLIDALQKHAITTGTLAIGSDTTKVKTTTDTYYFISGKLYVLAATDDLFTLSGTISDGYYNVYVLTVNAAGTVAAAMGTEATTVAGVVFPSTPAASAVVGFVLVYTIGATFIGGTTALSAGTVTDVYINATAPMRFV